MRRVVLLAFLPAVASAAPSPVESLKLEDLLDLNVAAATKISQPLSATPAVGAVLRRDQLDDFGWLTLNDVLYGQPGFFRSQDYERRVVGARGEREDWNNNRLLLLIDGMPQNDVETGTAFTWEVTPLYLAQRLEVLRGAGSALYGSYALNGVVSLETPTAAELGGRPARARLSLADDGGTVVDVLGAQGGQRGEVLIGVRQARTPGDRFVEPDGSGRTDEAGQPARFEVQDRHDAQTFFFKASGAGGLKGLSLTAQAQDWSYGTYRGWSNWLPDENETMTEHRQIVTLRYVSPEEQPLRADLALQYQNHGYEMNERVYPAGAEDGLYPNGVSEQVVTSLSNLFARAQVRLALPSGGTFLAGAEYTAIWYSGDDLHLSNASPSDGQVFQTMTQLGGIYEPMIGNLVSKVGVYAQATTGTLLGDGLELTAGLRFDDLFAGYTETAEEGRPHRTVSFEDLSPRLALVYRPHSNLGLKLMAARAFRTPTPVELFSRNTWTASSADPATMKGERQDTVELAADWRAAPWLRLRANGFIARLENEIGYDTTDSRIINRFGDLRAGTEAELLFDTTPAGAVALDGWLSYSYVALLDETVEDPGLAKASTIWRAPAHLLKAGLRLRTGRLAFAAQAYLQGEEERAPSDLLSETNRAARPDVVPAWLSVDLTLRIQATDWLRAGASVRNLFDSAGRLASPGDLPYDDHVPARQLSFELELLL